MSEPIVIHTLDQESIGKDFRSVAFQCSTYEDGKRWCAFCGTKLVTREAENTLHKEDCPLHRIRTWMETGWETAHNLLDEVDELKEELAERSES